VSRLENPRPATTTTVRIGLETHEQLRDLAERREEAMQETVSVAIERLAREQFFKELDEDYARLRVDPILWQQELEEREEWQSFDPWPDEK
jgi:hypothetical protein